MNEEQKGRQERAIVFIDGSNFYNSTKNTIKRVDIDFEKFVRCLSEENNFNLVWCFYYNAPLDMKINAEKYWKQQKFFDELKNIPRFTVKLAITKQRTNDDGTKFQIVRGDDIQIATDMLLEAFSNRYDTAILVSGDGDFVPVVQAVQNLGKKVINAYFNVSCSNFLKKTCDKSVLLDNFIMKCLKKEN